MFKHPGTIFRILKGFYAFIKTVFPVMK